MLKLKSKLFLPLLFIAFAGMCGGFYMSARSIMIVQNTWLYIMESNVTLNFALLFFLWGIACDKFTKGKGRAYQWIVFGIGVAVLILFFRFVGGYETLIG